MHVKTEICTPMDSAPARRGRLRVRVERYDPIDVANITSTERVVLVCGCALYSGRDHTGLSAIIGRACMVPHQRLVDEALAIAATNPSLQVRVDALATAERAIRPWIYDDES